MKNIDLVIIGGGSSGMAAAIQAKKEGVNSILVLEKDNHMGGVLNQCIHNGFGLTEFKEELTGPEYAQRFLDELKSLNIEYKTNSLVKSITAEKKVIYSNKEEGNVEVQAKAIISSVGCFERGAGMITLAGDRCAGVMTAGSAQRYLNIDGYMCGKKVVILGSGDIGLIMARRLTLEGAKVICVAELMPYSNGLNRNIQQCLIDFDIPLYLSTSVKEVRGKGRLQKVVLCKVDDHLQFIPGEEREIDCDCLILSVGLVPYQSLLSYIGVKLSPVTKGPIVNEHYMTSIPGIFACGNGLHIHDVVDFVSEESRQAAHGAVLYINGTLPNGDDIPVIPGENIGYVVPQSIKSNNKEGITFRFRVRKPIKDVFIEISSGDNMLYKGYNAALIPSEMISIKLPEEKIALIKEKVNVYLKERK